MKWFSVFLICALAFFSNACEMHKASELEEESNSAEAHAEPKDGAAAESSDKAKAEDAKPGEAPKFFPEKK